MNMANESVSNVVDPELKSEGSLEVGGNGSNNGYEIIHSKSPLF